MQVNPENSFMNNVIKNKNDGFVLDKSLSTNEKVVFTKKLSDESKLGACAKAIFKTVITMGLSDDYKLEAKEALKGKNVRIETLPTTLPADSRERVLAWMKAPPQERTFMGLNTLGGCLAISRQLGESSIKFRQPDTGKNYTLSGTGFQTIGAKKDNHLHLTIEEEGTGESFSADFVNGKLVHREAYGLEEASLSGVPEKYAKIIDAACWEALDLKEVLEEERAKKKSTLF